MTEQRPLTSILDGPRHDEIIDPTRLIPRGRALCNLGGVCADIPWPNEGWWAVPDVWAFALGPYESDQAAEVALRIAAQVRVVP